MHILQPKHTRMKPEEAKALLGSLNITAKQLPKIKKSDPVLPENAVEGDIIKIERKSDEGATIYYRIVVS